LAIKTLVDATALIPYYVTLFNMLAAGRCSAANDFKSSTSLAFLRVIRLVRIFKLTKHSLGLQASPLNPYVTSVYFQCIATFDFLRYTNILTYLLKYQSQQGRLYGMK